MVGDERGDGIVRGLRRMSCTYLGARKFPRGSSFPRKSRSRAYEEPFVAILGLGPQLIDEEMNVRPPAEEKTRIMEDSPSM